MLAKPHPSSRGAANLSPNADGTTYSGTTVPVYTGRGSLVSSTSWQWYPVPDSAKWGGFFKVAMPPVGTTYTTPMSGANVLIGCAGCAQNNKTKGYVAASVELAVYRLNAATAIGYCAVRMSSGVDLLEEHLYASTAVLTDSAPGSFKPEDGITTSIPGAPTPANAAFTPTAIFSQGLTGTCDSSTGVAYLACHLSVEKCTAPAA
ncbi:hypothetical protein HXX76_011930 [Chlamydomonas incerta]|uniref:Uncharacterized protein n=1 Tax=Chlamydomonas incerta TaxID=51695 RepID=A0A835SIV4_CHLIN|nr:hypothetical protein HXX76_011930 [Chlamydomonas incerta]|eukprot:KAG2427943.1 hypothetical protein HXX76_011930 [Chlamydomonas incerta]